MRSWSSMLGLVMSEVGEGDAQGLDDTQWKQGRNGRGDTYAKTF